MVRMLVLLLMTLLLLASCSSESHERLTISATTWIGYAPLFYAKEKGWLKPLNIKLLHVTSLSENMYLYEAGNADAYVGTQYEYNLLVKKMPSLIPVMTFDRSNGGDMIMSNRSIAALKKTEEPITAYLEMDSINNTLLKDFMERYDLHNKTVDYFNRDQATIALIDLPERSGPVLVVTYNPYDIKLRKNGFKEIASTKDGLELFVIDALFTTEDALYKHKEQFLALKKLVDDAVSALEQDPEEFYRVVKPYMLEVSYEEFEDSLSDIVWINRKLSPELAERMREAHLPIRDIL